MNKVAPVGIILLALLAVVLVFSIDRETEPPASPEDPTRSAFAVVTGKVLDPAGAPFAGVPVRALPAGPGVGEASADSVTDAEGVFSLRLVPAPGMFQIKAYPSGRSPFPGDCIVSATPGQEIEVILRESEQVSPEKDPIPIVAGAVNNQQARAQVGVGIEAVNETGQVLCKVVTDRNGRFEMVVDSVPPFSLRFEGEEKAQARITVLPSLNNMLFRKTPPPRKETLYIRVVSDSPPEDPQLKLQIFGPLAETIHTAHVQIPDSPWRIDGVPVETSDIRVWNGSLSGMLRRFDFGPECREAVVHLSPPAVVRATVGIPVRAVLVPSPPLAEPLGVELLQIDGRSERVRTCLQDTVKGVKSFEFAELHPGEYHLTLTAPGYEPFKIQLVLRAGETRDLGRIKMKPATGSATFHLNDRNQDTTRYGYLLTVYSRRGEMFSRKTEPGDSAWLRIERLGMGVWHYRTERRMEGGGLRSVESDLSFTVRRDQDTRVQVNLIWPWD